MTEHSAEAGLFGERGARAVVSVAPSSIARLVAIAAQYGIKGQRIGTVSDGDLRIQFGSAPAISGDVDSFRRSWAKGLEKALESA
jgi:hypothetical protein